MSKELDALIVDGPLPGSEHEAMFTVPNPVSFVDPNFKDETVIQAVYNQMKASWRQVYGQRAN